MKTTVHYANVPLTRDIVQLEKDIEFAVIELEKWGEEHNLKVLNMENLPANEERQELVIKCTYKGRVK